MQHHNLGPQAFLWLFTQAKGQRPITEPYLGKMASHSGCCQLRGNVLGGMEEATLVSHTPSINKVSTEGNCGIAILTHIMLWARKKK